MEDFKEVDGSCQLSAEHDQFMKAHRESGNESEETTAAMLDLSRVPPTGEEVYREHALKWSQMGLQTLGDLLRLSRQF